MQIPIERLPEGSKQFDITTVIYRINSVAVAIVDALFSMESTENARISQRTQYFDSLLANLNLNPNVVPSEQIRLYEELKANDKTNRRRILNWGLVMAWTSFEALMEDLLKIFFWEQPRGFLNWGGKLNVTYEEIQAMGQIDEVAESFYSKALRQFTDKPIKERLKDLQSKLGIREEDLFGLRFSNETIRARLKGWGPGSMEALSDARNDIVHRGALPLQSLGEFEDAVLVFERLLLNLGTILAEKMGIPITINGVPYQPDQSGQR